MTTTAPAEPTKAGQSSNPDRQVPTRRVSFEESLQSLPKHYAEDGDLIGSHVIAALSAVFPDGEDFFVRSVRNFRDQIEDPALKKQVAGFIGQEAIHGREHRAFNDRLGELGYPTKQVERLTEKGLALREKVATKKANLAATAALEHFTATLAELILGDERAQSMIGDQNVKNLFVWHALEESEHKAVAFDVYRAVGGSERTRVITMKVLRIGFILGMTLQVLVSLLMDKRAYNPIRLFTSLRKFVRSPFVSRETWRTLKEYDAPDFHPDDRDTTELVETWRAELFGDTGSLNEYLVGRPAA